MRLKIVSKSTSKNISLIDNIPDVKVTKSAVTQQLFITFPSLHDSPLSPSDANGLQMQMPSKNAFPHKNYKSLHSLMSGYEYIRY